MTQFPITVQLKRRRYKVACTQINALSPPSSAFIGLCLYDVCKSFESFSVGHLKCAEAHISTQAPPTPNSDPLSVLCV